MQIEKITRAYGEVQVPGDKSISHRGVMLGALGDGTTKIEGFLMGADCLSTIDCFRKLGIAIDVSQERVLVHGRGLKGLQQPKEQLYTGNSGTTTRLLCGLLAGQPFDVSITGDASICKRPMNRVINPLTEMGARFSGEFCPLTIHGAPLHGIRYQMPVASAQVKTALLLAGLYADGETVVCETEQSRNHTELLLAAMGADIRTDGLDVSIRPCKRLEAQHIRVPGDISSAAFFLVLGAILPNSELTVLDVGVNPTRAGIIEVLQDMGADIRLENLHEQNGELVADITVCSSELHGVTIGGALIPRLIDELPVIAVAAAYASGKTVIRDAQELKVKETNRIRAVVDELQKCGIDIKETQDGMVLRGGKPVRGAAFKSYGDHRMAMSLAVLAQRAEGESSIDDAACVNISYPGFFEDLHRLGQ